MILDMTGKKEFVTILRLFLFVFYNVILLFFITYRISELRFISNFVGLIGDVYITIIVSTKRQHIVF